MLSIEFHRLVLVLWKLMADFLKASFSTRNYVKGSIGFARVAVLRIPRSQANHYFIFIANY